MGDRRWKAWRKLKEAAVELAVAYKGDAHWMKWAAQLAKECQEHETQELEAMAGHPNPYGLTRER